MKTNSTFIDNTWRDLTYALRTIARAPLTSATIVLTVSLGLGVVAVLFSIVNVFLFRVDPMVPDITEIYSVERPQQEGGPSFFSRSDFEAMRTETTVFTGAYAAIAEVDLRVEGRVMNVTLVSGNFFDVVRVAPVMGRVFSAADDDRTGGNPVVVLSAKGWERRFKNDPNVIGRTILVGGTAYEVIGVMPAGFRGLEVGGPDLWGPLRRMADFDPKLRGKENSVGVDIVGRLKPGVSAASARAQLAAWDTNRSTAPTDRRGASVEVTRRDGTVPQPMEVVLVFTPLFLAFGLILMIGCANVANLLLARGVARQREIGIRLSLGASRRRIVRQLITESVVLSLISAAGGYLVSRVALEGAVYWMMRRMPMDIGDVNLNVPAADWRVGVFLVLSSLGATALFALIPALQATRVEPVRTLRGELVKDARPGRARNVLIGAQVFASALLLICAAIFLRSATESARFDPGLRTTDTVLIEINEPARAAMVRALSNESLITAVAGVRPAVLAKPLPGFADIGGGKTPITYKFVSGEYFDVLGIAVVRGRTFTAAESDAHPVAIVSESVARTLWPNGSGVGETLRLDPDLSQHENSALLTVNPGAQKPEPVTSRLVTIIGIVRDVRGFRITDVKEAGVFLPTRPDAPTTGVVARVQGDPDIARQTLLEHLSKVDPNLGMISTMRTVARLELLLLQIAFWVSVILGGLALLLTVSGLFSVLSYLVEQRTREIGVRMALGASAQNVARLVLMQTTRPVLFGLIGGAGLAAALASALLATHWGGVLGTIVRMTDPVAYLSSVTVIVLACAAAAWIPAARAARVDPMRTLRQE